MRIEPTGSSPVPAKAPGSTARAVPTPTSGATDPGTFAPSGDLAALLAAFRQTPEVRTDAVDTAAAQVAAGALNTPQAATETAKALATSGDLTPNP